MATNENYYTILTSYGKQALANAQASGTAVNITEFAVGDGNGSYYAPNETQTALKNEKYRAQINRITTDSANPNWVIVEGIIPADQGGFTIREIGIFDDAGNLVAIGNYPETYKPVLSQGAGNDMYIRFIMEVENVDSVQLKIDPAIVLASRKYVDDEITAHNSDTTAHADIRNEITTIENKITDTPASNSIPLSKTVLHPDWLISPIYQIPYTRISVGTTFPTNPILYDTFYKSDTDELYLFDGSNWLKIDWQKFIQAVPEFTNGKLRINGTQLEISNDGTNWFRVIPTIGKVVEINDDANIFFILPGQTAKKLNTNVLNIAYADDSAFNLYLNTSTATTGTLDILQISDIAATSEYIYFYSRYDGTTTVENSAYTNSANGLLINDVDTSPSLSFVNIQIVGGNAYSLLSARGSGIGNNAILIASAKCPLPSTGYFLGKIYQFDGTVHTYELIQIERVR